MKKSLKAFAVASMTVAVLLAISPEAEAAKGRKAKLAAGIAIGAVAAGTVAAIASSNNAQAAQPYYGQPQPYGYQAPVQNHYYTAQPQGYYGQEYQAVQPRHSWNPQRAIDACNRAGRKLYGYRHGRFDQVTSVEPAGRGMVRVEAYGRGYEGPYGSRIVCLSDLRGNVRDFAVY